METQRLRRRRSRRKARRRQAIVLVVVALCIGVGVWTHILVNRRNDATIFVATRGAPADDDGAKTPSQAAAPKEVPPTATRNLILFVGNGLGTVPLTATRIFSVGEDGVLAIDRLPETAMVRTSSRNAQTADAAAAMTAYMTGVKVDNEVLSQSADTRPYDEDGRPQSAHGETTCAIAGNGKRETTLLELAKASGRATGIVSTARVTQPTTAASYAHLCQRGGENGIAAQLVPAGPGANAQLGDGLDVILGGGWQAFLPKDDPRGSSRADSRDLFAELRAKGYAVVGRQVELAAVLQPQANAAPVGRLIGLFARAQMSYDADRTGTTEPSLADMTGRAIDLLGRNATGYVLIVDGGRIGEAFDEALARQGLQDARAFDDAVAVAIERARVFDPELARTTIVVTANHDHTLVINGDAATTERTAEARPGILGLLRTASQPTQSAVDTGGRPYSTLVFGAAAKRVRGPRSQAPPLSDVALGDRGSRYEAAIEVPESVGGADVPLAAIGANASRFHGTLDNTQVFALMREAMGL